MRIGLFAMAVMSDVNIIVYYRKSAKISMLRRMATCVVSYLDTSGIRHSVEVEAESLYEAAALAVRAFRRHDCEPQGLAKLEVGIRSSVTHTLTLKRLQEWLGGSCKSPKDAILKERCAVAQPRRIGAGTMTRKA